MDADSLKIIDANLNRAREGLRTCEEYARFVLADIALGLGLKSLRRSLQKIPETLGARELLMARDVPSDVGATPGGDRASNGHVPALAGIKRAQEACRVIEEFTKGHPAGEIASRVRYGCYEIEQRMFANPRRSRIVESAVMVVFTRALCDDWRATLSALLDAGADLFQIREKNATARELVDHVREFQSLAPDATVIINDRSDVARATHAQGVHVGQDDLSVTDARIAAGGASVIGVSTHNVAEALAAQESGADYIGLGAMFATTTKGDTTPAGPATLAEVTRAVEIPVFAIGGIHAGNVAELAKNGARHVAVSASILGSDTPATVYRQLVKALE